MPSKAISLRQIAQLLGVSHSTLSLWKRGKRSLRPDLEAKYWTLVTTNGDNSNHFNQMGIHRNTQVELNKMVPRGGLEPPTHGFSILPNDPINAFLDDRISRGLSVELAISCRLPPPRQLDSASKRSNSCI